MNRLSGMARGQGNMESSRGRFRQKKVPGPIRPICNVPEDSTKNEDRTVDEISYTDESDMFSSSTNDSQTLSFSSSYDTSPSKDIARSTASMFGGGFKGTLEKLGDRADRAIFGMDGVVEDTIGSGVLDFLDDSKYWKSNAKYWKSQALKRNKEGKVVKRGDFSVDDSAYESDDDSAESSEEGSKEDGGLEILLANDDESISSRQDESGFRVKSKEFIEANEADKKALKGEKKASDRNLVAPIKTPQSMAYPAPIFHSRSTGTRQQTESERDLVAPIKTPQSMAYPAPIFHSRSKVQGKDEELNGPAVAKLINSGSSETSFHRVLGKSNVVDKSGSEIEVHFPTPLEDGGVEIERVVSPVSYSGYTPDASVTGRDDADMKISKDLPGKRVPMKVSGGGHMPFDEEDKDGTLLYAKKIKTEQKEQAPAHDRNKTAPHQISEVTSIDNVESRESKTEQEGKRRTKIAHEATQSPTRSRFYQRAQNSPRANSSFHKKLPAATASGILQDSSRLQTMPINMTIQSKQDSDNILQDLRHLTRAASQTGISPPRPALPPTPTRNGARPRAGFPEWEDEDELFDFSEVEANASSQASVAPAIEPMTPKTNAFSSTQQIQAAASPVSKPTAPTTNASPFKIRPLASSARDKKPLVAKAAAFPPAETSTAPASIPITPKPLTRAVSQTGILAAVPTHAPYSPDVPPPPSLPPTPERNGARPRGVFSEWEDEMFDFRQVEVNAFTQASVAPAIKPMTPKTKTFSSSKQIQAAAALVSKPTALTTSASPFKMHPLASPARANKPSIAKIDTLPPAKTSTAPVSNPITPKTNELTPKQHPLAPVGNAPVFALIQHPHAAVAPVSKPMARVINGFAAKKQRQPLLAKEKQFPPSQPRKDAPPPSLQVSRQTFPSRIQSQVSSTPVSKRFPRKALFSEQHPQGPVAPVSQSFAPKEKPLPPSMTMTSSAIAPQPLLQAPRQPTKVTQPIVEPSSSPTVDAGGWEDFENPFANDFKNAFANAHPKVSIAT
jgi:hypothetical protein